PKRGRAQTPRGTNACGVDEIRVTDTWADSVDAYLDSSESRWLQPAEPAGSARRRLRQHARLQFEEPAQFLEETGCIPVLFGGDRGRSVWRGQLAFVVHLPLGKQLTQVL